MAVPTVERGGVGITYIVRASSQHHFDPNGFRAHRSPAMANDAILVTHVATERHALTPKHIEATTAPWHVRESFRITPPQREELNQFDETYPWIEAAQIQHEQFRQVRAAMHAYPDARLLYMGFAPVPLTVHLGSLFGQTTKVSVHQHHHLNLDWRWTSDQGSPDLLGPLTRPAANPTSSRDVLIRVSVSHPVSVEDTRWISDDRMHEYEVSLARPHPDALKSPADLEAFARAFKQAIDAAHNDFHGAPVRHLAASVPVGAALVMGMQINPTMHLPIQTWKYLRNRRRRYVRALRLGEYIDLPRALLLGASPLDQIAISAAHEVQELGILLGEHPRRISVAQRSAAGTDSLSELLGEFGPTVLHIACHGEERLDDPSTTLILTTSDGWTCKVDTEDLLRLLDRAPRLCCVVLMACMSDKLAQQITQKVPTSIGWAGTVVDADARAFAREFWKSLVAGNSVYDAYRDGRMAQRGPRDRAVLECGEGVDAHKVVPIPKT